MTTTLKRQGGWIVPTAVIAMVLIIIGVSIWGTYVGAYDKGVGYEKNLDAAWASNEAVRSSLGLKVKDLVKVSKLNASQVTELITKANEARYGGDGSKAAWQWIQENNLGLDQSLNKQIMAAIEAGRDEFKMAQKALFDTKRAYETALEKKYFLGEGWWLDLAGFPRVDLAKYKVISDEQTREAFKTGLDTSIIE